MPCILLLPPGKSPQITNNMSSMQCKGNTQLKNLKYWVPLISALYLFYFWSDLCKYLSIISARCPTEKTLKVTVHFLKTTMIHP